MNTYSTNAQTNRRRLMIRLSLIISWIGFGILLFISNRGHTLIIDNKDDDIIRASNIKVTLDKGKSAVFSRGDRDLFNVSGGRHYLYIEYTDGTPPFETRFTLPLGPDMFLLSIPRITAGAENAIEVFHRQRESRNTETEDEPITTD